MKYNSIFEMIGNTPLLEIPKEVHGFSKVKIYAKLEYFNPLGSIKDRTAYALIKNHLDEIKNNKKTIIECSSGNMAKSLAIFGGIIGTDCKIISNRVKIQEQKEVMGLFGVDFEELSSGGECPDPRSQEHPVQLIKKEISKNPEKYFYTDQYFNYESVNYHYETTGEEIWKDLGGKVDYFLTGLGTTGSSRGIINKLKEKNNKLKAIGIVSERSDFIPGIRTNEEMWEVGLYDKELYDNLIEIDSNEALEKMNTLIRKVGITGGPTTGSNYAGVLKYIKDNYESIQENSTFVFIACDRFETYLSYIKKRKPEFLGEKENDFCTFYTTPEDDKKVKFIHPDDLHNSLGEKKYFIIDTRSNSSFKNIHIHSSINIPNSMIYTLVDKDNFPFCKSLEIVLVCPYGQESIKLSSYLNLKGYNTWVLQGGLEDYIDLGYDVERI